MIDSSGALSNDCCGDNEPRDRRLFGPYFHPILLRRLVSLFDSLATTVGFGDDGVVGEIAVDDGGLNGFNSLDKNDRGFFASTVGDVGESSMDGIFSPISADGADPFKVANSSEYVFLFNGSDSSTAFRTVAAETSEFRGERTSCDFVRAKICSFNDELRYRAPLRFITAILSSSSLFNRARALASAFVFSKSIAKRRLAASVPVSKQAGVLKQESSASISPGVFIGV